MKRTIQVQLGDAERNVGTLHYDAVGSRERSAFAYHPSWLDAPDCEQLWRRLVFSILITNVDDHLRNHGFLHADRGLWRLAPAFDINPFPDRVRELKTWPSEGTGPEATIDASLAVIAYFGIKPSRAQAILGEVEAAVGRRRAEGRSLGMTARELDSYVDAFEHPQREAARRAL